jgi:hypothetical protein
MKNINYKIKKYSYKLNNAKTLEKALIYQDKLKYYSLCK